MTVPHPTTLIVLDGWGESERPDFNPILAADKPVWDRLRCTAPFIALHASGSAVGLPEGQVGNSEVGHLTLGAGRVMRQDLSRIDHSIERGLFFENPTLIERLGRMNQLGSPNPRVHVLGLTSPGGVHSHERHLFALLQLLNRFSRLEVCIHAFLDGRDTPPRSALTSIEKLDACLEELASPRMRLVSVCGRYYAMDRDQRWERTQAAVDLLLNHRVEFCEPSAQIAIETAYGRGESDEFVQPTRVGSCISDAENFAIQAEDLVICTHFRADRVRQLCRSLKKRVPAIELVTFTEYEPDLTPYIVFPAVSVKNSLGQVIADHQCRQFRLAESEKYAHVTFFFNGGLEVPFEGEERLFFPSPKVRFYDEAPHMRALELTEALVSAILSRRYDFILCNYANPDMLGHTGDYEATKQAIEIIDACLGRVIAALDQIGGQALITADHGNAECLYDLEHQQAHTAHTNALVPCLYHGPLKFKFRAFDAPPSLADVAPTILKLMGLDKPSEMTGQALF